MKKFSVATFNLFNLNEPGLPMYKDTKGWSQEQYNLKIAWTARQIDLLNADVLAFQELWQAESLKSAFNHSSVAGEYQLLVPTGATGKKIICAAAVHHGIPVESLEWIEDFPENFVLDSGGGDAQTPAIAVTIKGFWRPILHALLRLHPMEPLVHLYVCHFKSKGPTDLFREPWYDKAVHGMHHSALGTARISTDSSYRRSCRDTSDPEFGDEGHDKPVIVIGDINDGQSGQISRKHSDRTTWLPVWRF